MTIHMFRVLIGAGNRPIGQTDWCRLGYHNCTHREGDGSDGPCSWDDVAEWTANGTSIPSGVPNIL